MSGPLGWAGAQRLVRGLESHRPHPLRSLVRGAGLHRTALDNAHRALDDVHRSVAERATLHEAGSRRVVPLSRKETVELLERQAVGRLAYIARKNTPDVVPVNYVWAQGVVLIRSGPGPKLQAAERGETVAHRCSSRATSSCQAPTESAPDRTLIGCGALPRRTRQLPAVSSREVAATGCTGLTGNALTHPGGRPGFLVRRASRRA